MILFRILTRSQTRLVLVEILIKLRRAQHCAHQCNGWHPFWSSNLYYVFHPPAFSRDFLYNEVWYFRRISTTLANFWHFRQFLAASEIIRIHCGPGGSALWWMTATCLILGHRDNSGEKDDSAKSKKPPLTLCTFFSLFVLLWHDLKDGQFGVGWWCQTIWRIFFSVVVWTLEVYIWRKTFQRIKCLWNLSKIR